MNLKSISNRIKRLEKHGRKATGTIRIASAWNTWIVMKDGKQFETLEEAIKHVKSKYVFNTIAIDQVRKVVDSLTTNQLREISHVFGSDDRDNEQNEPARQKYYKIIFTPCTELAASEKKHPEYKFELTSFSYDKTHEV
ncbi:hypothetical protein E0712_04600 [Lactobacillus helveticus]|uniref:hypothetical protein n=1 Tax=Lactobacillus helveticus TaxID=1587 RepID=UPI001C653ECA|nr:hypothetical protein [Lactobacillus helveticus]MBW8013751.1 hypothetical protein [Lactobacillus helveticus]